MYGVWGTLCFYFFKFEKNAVGCCDKKTVDNNYLMLSFHPKLKCIT